MLPSYSLFRGRTKSKVEAAELQFARRLTAPFLLDVDLNRTKPKHVVLLMDLDGPSAFESDCVPHCDLSYGKAEHPKKGKKGDKSGKWVGYADRNEEGDRFCLNIRGHSPHEYPVITGFENQFDQLFQWSLGYAHPMLGKFNGSKNWNYNLPVSPDKDFSHFQCHNV
jgi:hypothetical protein